MMWWKKCHNHHQSYVDVERKWKMNEIPTILSWWIFVIIIPIVIIIIIIKLENRKLLYYNWNVLNVCKKKTFNNLNRIKIQIKKKKKKTDDPPLLYDDQRNHINCDQLVVVVVVFDPTNKPNQPKQNKTTKHTYKQKDFPAEYRKNETKTSWNHELFWTK